MEKGKTYTYQGFTFSSEAELAEAKKEAEVVAYIRSQADLGNVKTVLKLYNRLIEKGTLSTVLGVAFLKELRSGRWSPERWRKAVCVPCRSRKNRRSKRPIE